MTKLEKAYNNRTARTVGLVQKVMFLYCNAVYAVISRYYDIETDNYSPVTIYYNIQIDDIDDI